MTTRRKLQIAAAALFIAALLIFLLVAIAPPTPIGNALAISFLGFTNYPGNNHVYGRFSISNQASYEVRFRGRWSEVQGNQNLLAPLIDPRMPECRLGSVLNGHAALVTAVGEPSNEPASAPWRLCVAYSQHDTSSKAVDLSFRYRWLGWLRANRLVNAQRVLDPTNQVFVGSSWLQRK